jgi:hypothetical protein
MRRAEVESACAKRVFDAAGHVARQVGPAPARVGGRRPRWRFAFRAHLRHAAPGEANAADAIRVLPRLAVAKHQLAPALTRIVPGLSWAGKLTHYAWPAVG